MSTRHSFASQGNASVAPHGSLFLDAVRLVETWIDRVHQRRALRALPDYLMQDVAISRADVEAESAKPFWQP